MRRPGPGEAAAGRRLRLLLGVALAAVGTGSFLVGTGLDGAQVVAGRNRAVNVSAGDLRNVEAHNSPTLVRNPRNGRNLVVVNRVDQPRFSARMHVSFDGGTSWRGTRLPFPAGEELPERLFAPDAAFGPDGNLYVTYATLEGFGNTPNATWLVTSGDGGRTVSEPTRVLGPLAFQVRVAADPERARRLYLTWVQAGEVGNLQFGAGDNPVHSARSDDGGATWSAPVRVNPTGRRWVLAPSVVAAASERVLVLYLDVGEDALDYHGAHEGRGGEPYAGKWALVLARSDDAGKTWSETLVDAAVVPTQRFVAFFPPAPSLAVDPTRNRVYAAFHDGRFGDADVVVWSSKDGGGRFSPPVRVNDTPRPDATTQHLPRLAVAGDGRLDVAYYDRRGDPADARAEVSLQSSSDAGATFGPRRTVSDRRFDARIGFGSERGMAEQGSRLGLASLDDAATVVWADTRAGVAASNKQDLAAATTAFRGPAAARDPLRVAGGAVALAGALLIATTAMPRFSLRS